MKNKKFKKMVIPMIGAILLVAVLAFFVVKSFTGNVVKDNSEKSDWLNENCDCIERNNLRCPEGYYVDGNLCRSENNTVTYPILGCSAYDCDGEIWRIKN